MVAVLVAVLGGQPAAAKKRAASLFTSRARDATGPRTLVESQSRSGVQAACHRGDQQESPCWRAAWSLGPACAETGSLGADLGRFCRHRPGQQWQLSGPPGATSLAPGARKLRTLPWYVLVRAASVARGCVPRLGSRSGRLQTGLLGGTAQAGPALGRVSVGRESATRADQSIGTNMTSVSPPSERVWWPRCAGLVSSTRSTLPGGSWTTAPSDVSTS